MRPCDRARMACDRVRQALGDTNTQVALLNHALAFWCRRLFFRPVAVWQDEAENAFQETMVRALERCRDYDLTRPIRPWLHGFMNNVLRECRRSLDCRPAQEPPNSDVWDQIEADLGSFAPDAINRRLDFETLMANLSSEHQQILRLRFWEELTHQEIAVRLGLSIENSRIRLWRAIKGLGGNGGNSEPEGQP